MLELTGGAPKELIEVGGVPVIVRILVECAESGIEDVLIVLSPEKHGIAEVLAPLEGHPEMPRSISFAVQDEPRGLADAIRLGREFSMGGPLAVALPDNLFAGSQPGLRQVIETHIESGMNVVAIVEITADQASKRGPTPMYPGEVRSSWYVIDRIPAKGEKAETFNTSGAASAFTGVGRYVFTPDVFDAIDLVERELSQGEELDDVPVMQRLLAQGTLVGRRVDGQFFDVGIVAGYREADTSFRETAYITDSRDADPIVARTTEH